MNETMYILSPNATIFILSFSVFYLAVVVRRIANSRLSPEDAFLLSTLALIPIVFVVAPHYVSAITRLVGVEYPFLLMFGFFHFITFVMLDRVLRMESRHSKEITILSQELALLRGEFESFDESSLSNNKVTANNS